MTGWDRYLFRRMFRVFWRTVLVFVTLIVLIDYITHRRDAIIEQEISFVEVARYYALIVPEFLIRYQTAALAVFVASLLVLGDITRHSESVALLSGGVALHRIVLAPLLLAALVSTAVFAAGQSVAPWADAEAHEFEARYFGARNTRSNQRAGLTWAHLEDEWKCHVGVFNRQAMAGEDVLMARVTDDHVRTVRARRIYWDDSDERWYLEQGISFESTPDDQSSRTVQTFGRLRAPITEPPDNLFAEDVRPTSLTLRKIRKLEASLAEQGRPTQRLRLQFHTQLASPLLAIILVALSIPFGMQNARSGGLARGLVLCVACALTNLIASSIAQGLGASGRWHPITAAWAVNAGFAIFAAILIRRTPT